MIHVISCLSYTCRCLSVLSSYGVSASEKAVLTFTLVWGRMRTSASTLLEDTVQKERRFVHMVFALREF